MNYRIVEKEAFRIMGVKLGCDFSKDSEETAEMRRNYTKFNLLINMPDEEIPDAMKKIFKPGDGGAKKIDVYAGVGHLFRAPLWRVGITQTLDDGVSWIAVGAEADDGEYDKNHTWNVPGGTWAVFTVKGKLRCNTDESGQYDVFSEVYSSVVNRRISHQDSELLQPIDKIFARADVEWMDQSGYERAGNYEMMVYPLGDTESDDYYCEAWIPVRKKITF